MTPPGEIHFGDGIKKIKCNEKYSAENLSDLHILSRGNSHIHSHILLSEGRGQRDLLGSDDPRGFICGRAAIKMDENR